MTDTFALFETIVLCSALAVILWVGPHASRRKRDGALPPAALIGISAWLAVFGFALYLMFG